MTEKMGGERVAQEVRPNFLRQAGELRDFLDDLPEPHGGETMAMLAEKNFATGLGLDQKRPATRQPKIKRRHGFFANGHDSFAIPFPITRSSFSSRK